MIVSKECEKYGCACYDDRVDEGVNVDSELKQCVYEFFTNYLNYVEESDSGKLFNPVTIGSCRVLMIEPLNNLLEKMRELSEAGPNPLYERIENEENN